MATSNSASQAQILALSERMDRNFGEVKAMLQGFDERLRSLENREAGCQPMVQSRIDAAWRKLDDHDTKISAANTNHLHLMNQVKNLYSILNWILGILTLIIGAVAVALVTGRAVIQFLP